MSSFWIPRVARFPCYRREREGSISRVRSAVIVGSSDERSSHNDYAKPFSAANAAHARRSLTSIVSHLAALMRLFRIILTLVALSAVPGRAEAPLFLPGQHDEEGAKLLQRMSQVIPLRTTRLQTVAPEFAIEKRAGLTWADAVAEADSEYGKKDPKRFAFLRRYLAAGSPEINLADL